MEYNTYERIIVPLWIIITGLTLALLVTGTLTGGRALAWCAAAWLAMSASFWRLAENAPELEEWD